MLFYIFVNSIMQRGQILGNPAQTFENVEPPGVLGPVAETPPVGGFLLITSFVDLSTDKTNDISKFEHLYTVPKSLNSHSGIGRYYKSFTAAAAGRYRSSTDA